LLQLLLLETRSKRPRQVLSAVRVEKPARFVVTKARLKDVFVRAGIFGPLALPAAAAEPVRAEPPARVALDRVQQRRPNALARGLPALRRWGGDGRAERTRERQGGVNASSHSLATSARALASTQTKRRGGSSLSRAHLEPIFAVHRVAALAAVVERPAALFAAAGARMAELLAPQVVLHKHEAKPAPERQRRGKPARHQTLRWS